MDVKDTLLAVSGLLGGSGGGGSSGPVITLQPADFTGDINDTASFHVAASGNNLSYQWQTYSDNKWVNNSFSTSQTDTLTMIITAARVDMQYRCKITDGNGNVVNSNPATLRATASTPTLVTKTITENGTYAASSDNADGYSEVTVSVPTKDYDANDWLDKSKPVGTVVYTGTVKPPAYGLYERNGITRVRVTAAQISDHIITSSSATSFFADVATSIPASGFWKATHLVHAVFPKVANIAGNDAFNSCSALVGVDFGGTYTSGNGIANYCFKGCPITTLILRGNSVWALQNVNAFASTPFANGGTGGHIYIPKSLYDHLGDGTANDYKAATNWSTLNGYGTITWHAIEGSIYETQYVDGTPISS